MDVNNSSMLSSVNTDQSILEKSIPKVLIFSIMLTKAWPSLPQSSTLLKLIETEETDPKISLICGPTLSLRIFGNELDNSFELPIATNRSVKEFFLATKVSKSIEPSIIPILLRFINDSSDDG